MNIAAINAGLSSRLAETRELVSAVRAAEAPLLPLPALAAVIRGYVFVSCYGALEFAVTAGTQEFINNIKASGVRNAHLELPLNSVALHPQLMSLEDSGGKRRWDARRSLFECLDENVVCEVQDTVFGGLTHNIWPQTISEIFSCFGIKKPPASQPREFGYMRELVEKRNAVAHGRQLAADAGEGRTADDLETMTAAIYNVCRHFLDSLEYHASEKLFIKAAFRAHYR